MNYGSCGAGALARSERTNKGEAGAGTHRQRLNPRRRTGNKAPSGMGWMCVGHPIVYGPESRSASTYSGVGHGRR